jgi:hypothetical protein
MTAPWSNLPAVEPEPEADEAGSPQPNLRLAAVQIRNVWVSQMHTHDHWLAGTGFQLSQQFKDAAKATKASKRVVDRSTKVHASNQPPLWCIGLPGNALDMDTNGDLDDLRQAKPPRVHCMSQPCAALGKDEILREAHQWLDSIDEGNSEAEFRKYWMR